MGPTAPPLNLDLHDENQRLRLRIEELEAEVDSLRAELQGARAQGIQDVIGSAPMGVALVDQDGRYVAVNHALARLQGLSPEAHRGRLVEDVVPSLAPQIRGGVRRVMEAGQAFEEELITENAAPSDRGAHWSIHWFPFTGPAGKVLGAGALVTNVTARKLMEQALRESEAALAESNRTIQRQLAEIEALYASTQAAIALIDPNFRFVRLNRRAAEINGVPVEQSIGKKVAEVIPELWPTLAPYFTAVVETHLPQHGVEIRGKTRAKPGSEKVWLADYDPVFDAGGKFLGVSAIVMDITESVRAGEAAQRQLSEIEAIYASTPIALCVYDEQLRFVRANHRLAELNGLSPEEHIGRTVREVAPDFAEQAEAALRRLLENGEPLVEIEMAGRPPSGGDRGYWNNRWAPVKDASGRLVGVSVAIEEVTARRKAEESLRESERLYRAIGESIDYGVWVCAPDGRCTYASDSFLKLLGISAEECRDFGWADKLHPNDRERTVAAWQEAVRAGGPWDVEHRFMGTDGQYHAVLARGVPLRNDQGEVICWAGLNLDISALKGAQESLRQSERRERARAAELEAMMDAVPAAICISRDPDGIQMTTNRTGCRMLRIPAGANMSMSSPEGPRHMRILREGREVPPEELPVQVAGRTGREVHDVELEIVFDDGEQRHLIGNAVPLLDGEGRRYGALGAFVDVTERKRSEERLRHAQKLESIGLLAGGVAHDFNNLLVGVIGNASLAHEMLPPSHPCAPLVEEVIKIGERAALLTRQMLAYAGKGQFLIEPLHLSTVIAEMQDLLKPGIPSKVTLQLELAEDLPTIFGDRGQMQQVFMNLVLNAAEAIGDKVGTISVRTGAYTVPEDAPAEDFLMGDLQPGPHVYLQVRDSGCGMDETTRTRIFEPFYTTKFTGRGLGLAATAGVVAAHKGAVKVASAPGRGTTFTIYFPVTRGEHSEDAEAPPVAVSGGAILVVDDDKTVRDVAERCLERQGFQVLPAGSGAEAVEILQRNADGCVMAVLDLNMPGMNGLKTLLELRRIRPDLPIVISSGYDEPETMRQLDGQKVAAFLQKPYTAQRLAETVAKIVAPRAAQ